MRLRAPMIVAAYCMMIFSGAMHVLPEQVIIEHSANAITVNHTSTANTAMVQSARAVASPEFEHAMRMGD